MVAYACVRRSLVLVSGTAVHGKDTDGDPGYSGGPDCDPKSPFPVAPMRGGWLPTLGGGRKQGRPIFGEGTKGGCGSKRGVRRDEGHE